MERDTKLETERNEQLAAKKKERARGCDAEREEEEEEREQDRTRETTQWARRREER